MPGFMPGIHVLWIRHEEDVDGRDFRREDGASRLLPGHGIMATPVHLASVTHS